MENSVNFSDGSVGGNFTGRDDKSLQIVSTYSKSDYLDNLYRLFEKEMEDNPELKDLCEELNFLNTEIQNQTVIGLENKLIAGNRQNLVAYALDVKDRFVKKLMRTSQYSLVAQDVNVFILSKIKRTFIMEIFEKIIQGEDNHKINLIISERIIKPVMADLGINLFKYTEEDVMGMIFYLTGNCHINWAE